jgi:hypothetical protein
MWGTLWWEDMPAVYNCCWALPVQSFLGLSLARLMTILLLSQIWDSPNLEGQVPVFLPPPPPEQSSPLIPPGTGCLHKGYFFLLQSICADLTQNTASKNSSTVSLLSGLLSSNGLGILDVEVCFGWCGNMFTSCCLAMDVFLCGYSSFELSYHSILFINLTFNFPNFVFTSPLYKIWGSHLWLIDYYVLVFGGSMLLQNVSRYLLDYTLSYCRGYYSSRETAQRPPLIRKVWYHDWVRIVDVLLWTFTYTLDDNVYSSMTQFTCFLYEKTFPAKWYSSMI